MVKRISAETADRARQWLGDLVDMVDNHPFFEWQWSIVDVAMLGLVFTVIHT